MFANVEHILALVQVAQGTYLSARRRWLRRRVFRCRVGLWVCRWGKWLALPLFALAVLSVHLPDPYQLRFPNLS